MASVMCCSTFMSKAQFPTTTKTSGSALLLCGLNHSRHHVRLGLSRVWRCRWTVIGLLIFQIILALFLRPPLVRAGTLPRDNKHEGRTGDVCRALLQLRSLSIASWAAIKCLPR